MNVRKDFLDQLDEAIDNYLSGSQSPPDINIKLSTLAKRIPSPPSSPCTPPTSTIPVGRKLFGHQQYNSPPSPPSSTSSPSSPRSSPSAMPRNANSNAPVKVEKSRTVKRNYQRRKQGFHHSTQQLRQIERNEELKRRADKIKAKEKRAKDNKVKKEEKERKAREERERLGLHAPGSKPDPAQYRLTQLFTGRKKVVSKEQSSEQEESRSSDCDNEAYEEPEECLLVTPLEPVQVYEDREAKEHSSASDVADGSDAGVADQFTLPIRSLTSTPVEPENREDRPTESRQIASPPPSHEVNLGLPKDWEVYIDTDAEIEQELANNGYIPSASPSTIMAGTTSTSYRKILTPKRPSTKSKISKEQLADEVIAMISTQDLASDKENLDPTQPSSDEKAPDYTISVNKLKRGQDETIYDGDNESSKSKRLMRTPLKSLLKLEATVATLEASTGPVYDIGVPYSRLDTPLRVDDVRKLRHRSSSPDEYGFKDLAGFEDELAAEVDQAETKLMARLNGTLSQEWCHSFMMGTQELKELGLKA